MVSSVYAKDEIWFLRVCHHVPHDLYFGSFDYISLLEGKYHHSVKQVVMSKSGTRISQGKNVNLSSVLESDILERITCGFLQDM